LTINWAVEVPLNVAVIVGVVTEATAPVVTVKFAFVAPVGTVMELGTEAAALLLESATTIPPAGASAFRVTDPVVEVPPVTLFGFRETMAEVTGGSVIVRTVVCVPFIVAEMVASTVLVTALVVIAKVAEEAPAGTTTLAGTVAVGSLLDRVTVVPPKGAGPFNFAVPVDELPPVTDNGFTETDWIARANGFTVSVVVTVAPAVAEIVAVVVVPTELVLMPNVTELDPPGTVTLAGTVTAALSLDSVTGVPPTGATTFNVTVPVDAYVALIVDGLTVTDEATGVVTVKDPDWSPFPEAVITILPVSPTG